MKGEAIALADHFSGEDRERMRPPGILAKFYDFHLAGAAQPSPVFARQASLMLGSVIMARRFRSAYGNWPVVYGLSVGATGCGKERSRAALQYVLNEAGCIERCGARGFTSPAAVTSSLAAHPSLLVIQDEFGDLLANAKDRGQGYQRQVLSLYRELWGQAGLYDGGRLSPQGYSPLGKSKAEMQALSSTIERPALSVLGLSTPKQLFAALAQADLENGFLPRLLVEHSSQRRGKMHRPRPQSVPVDLLKWIRECLPGKALGVVDAHGKASPPEPITLGFSDAAEKLREAFDDEQLKLEAQHVSERTELEGLFVRTHEHSLRIAVIAAVSLGENEITSEAMQWAIDYVREVTAALEKMLRENLIGSDLARLLREVREVIAKHPGASLSDLARHAPLRNYGSRDRRNFLQSLEESGEIRSERVAPVRGQVRVRFYAEHRED